MSPESSGRRPDDDEAFDAIVQNLGLDFDFPDATAILQPKPEPRQDASEDLDDRPEPDDEPFYRRVEPSGRPWTVRRSLALAAVAGPPLLLVLCTVVGYWLPRGVVVAAVLTFVAGSIWWIAQLPEHGPGRPDWPDDGAAL